MKNDDLDISRSHNTIDETLIERIMYEQWLQERKGTLSEPAYQRIKASLRILDIEDIPFFDELRENGIHKERLEKLNSFSISKFLSDMKNGLATNIGIAKDYFEDLLRPCVSQPILAVRNNHEASAETRQARHWTLSHIAMDEGLPIELSLRTDHPENAVQYFTLVGVMDSFLTSEVDPTIESSLSQDSVRELWSGSIEGSSDQPRAVLSFELPEGICLADQQPEGRELKKENGHWLLALRLTHKK